MRTLLPGTWIIALFLTGAELLAQDRRINQDLTGLPQGETMVAVNPNNPQHLVATWIDWDAPSGQGTTTFHARSLDGGATWQTAETTASGGSDLRSRIDPAVAFDGLGNVYEIFATPQHPLRGAWVLRSTDGGLTFVGAAPLEPPGSIGLDKPWIAADLASNNVYATWTLLPNSVRVSRSTNQGVTFSSPVTIAAGSTSMVAVGPDGQVYVVYFSGSQIRMDRSLNGGANWLTTDLIVASPIVIPPSVGNGGIDISLIPTIAVDRTNGPFRGRIYVVWSDGRNGDADVYMAHSGDQGATWSAVARVNGDYVGGGTDQLNPTNWVDDAGHVHIAFLDRREDPDNLRLAVYLATSTDGGVTLGPEIRVSEPGLVQGGLLGQPNRWLGDYGGGVGAGGKNHIVWSDGRFTDLDVFYRQVDDADFDGDGILNDGNGDGQYANARCTGGQTQGCDDNCPGTSNAGQADTDGDLVGDGCDNCPSATNANQHDRDRDGAGDACDPCPANPGRPAGDPDADGFAECADNCPGLANPTQADADADGRGDLCDPCPSSASNDQDGDGRCEGADNCASSWNPKQADGDGDGAGNVCDVCPAISDPGQNDADGDGQGDACDCEPGDLFDRSPRDIRRLRAFKSGLAASFGWIGSGVAGPGSSGMPGRGFDAFSVARGLLSTLHAPGSLGSCLVEGLKRGFTDAALPPAGDGFFYLAQGQSFECGMGSLGFASGEFPRVQNDPLACDGHPFTDIPAFSETPVSGTVTGDLAATTASDNVYEAITEVVSGSTSQLEHRWSFTVPPGAGLVEVHIEGFWTDSADADQIRPDWSTDGGATFTPVFSFFGATSDTNVDSAIAIPPISGAVILRVIDTNRTPGATALDQVSLDKLWIRAVP